MRMRHTFFVMTARMILTKKACGAVPVSICAD